MPQHHSCVARINTSLHCCLLLLARSAYAPRDATARRNTFRLLPAYATAGSSCTFLCLPAAATFRFGVPHLLLLAGANAPSHLPRDAALVTCTACASLFTFHIPPAFTCQPAYYDLIRLPHYSALLHHCWRRLGKRCTCVCGARGCAAFAITVARTWHIVFATACNTHIPRADTTLPLS